MFGSLWTRFPLRKKQNLKLVALVVKNGKTPDKIDKENCLLVVGSEAHGLPENWLKDCDELMTLPMPGGW